MRTVGTVILLLLAAGGTSLWAWQHHRKTMASLAGAERGPVPIELDVPSLADVQATAGPIFGHALWGLDRPEVEDATRTAEASATPIDPDTAQYSVKVFDTGEAVYRIGRERERWTLFGILRRGDDRYAVFHEERDGEPLWRLLGLGEELAPHLTVASIGEHHLDLAAAKNEPGDQTLSLRIFRVYPEVASAE
jgi:hypothetical protein